MLSVIEAFRQGVAELKASGAQQKLFRAVDAFDWAAWNAEVKKILNKEFRAILRDQANATSRSIGVSFRYDDPFVQQELTSYVGARIKELEATSKQDVKTLIRARLEAGIETVANLGDLIRDAVQEKFEGYEDWRADRIARTETAIAYNNGTVFASRQAGLTHVEVSDGDEDEECAKADGEIWTIEEALANPIAHPNCTRAFSPVSKEEEE